MSHAFTPRAYAAQVSKYRPGDPRHTVAAMRAVLSAEAAKAARDGNYGRASQALNGLHRIAGLGALDTSALSARITSSITATSGRLTPNARAIATGRLVGAVASIGPLVGGIGSIIAGLTGDPGVIKAAGWVNLILGGGTVSMTEADARLVRGACPTINLVITGVQTLVTTARTLLTLADPDGDPAVMNGVQEFVAWVTLALQTICNDVSAVVPAPQAEATCAQATQRPGVGATPAGADGCCPGLIYNASIDRCVEETAASPPAVAAKAAWIRALTARRAVEPILAYPGGFTATAVADAQSRDGITAFDLCEAEKTLLTFMPTLPVWGSPPSQSTIDGVARRLAAAEAGTITGADKIGLAIALPALFNYMPPSAKPRCYIAQRPTGGCPAGCGSSGGGAGAIVALALPALAFAWYMMK